MARPRFQKLHTQIVFALALLLLLAQAATMVSINRILTRSTREDMQQSLRKGAKVFQQMREAKGQQLGQAAQLLAADYAFRQTVATKDTSTILSMLTNHGSRIHAPVMILADLDQQTLAATLDSARHRSFPLRGFVDAADRDGQATALAVLDGQLYQVVVVPVLAPIPIAWLGVGVPLDEAFLQNLHALTDLEISILTRPEGAKGWKLLASTHAAPAGLESLNPEDRPAWEQTVNGEPFSTTALHVEAPGEAPTLVLLQESIWKAQAPLRRLRWALFFITGISLAGTLLAGEWFTRGITGPINALGESARRIQGGDYQQRVQVARGDEIGALAGAFNHMMEGLATRELRIMDLAYRDQLTGLPNRAQFTDWLGQELRSAHRDRRMFTILFVDLDRFREVNDLLGHHMGDRLLEEVARRLGAEIQRSADVLARLGGDEFAILLPSTDLTGALLMAQRLSGILQQPVNLEGEKVSLGGSIGLAAFPDHGEDIASLLSHAELAMYEAKRNNSGFAVYDPSFDTQNPNQLSLMEELREALRLGHLELFYQPKLSLESGTVHHAEALIRWRHPERGLIPPGQFIPYAEKTGFIRKITEWAIGEGLRQSAAWRAEGVDLVISLNLSARDLMNKDLLDIFQAQLQIHGARPESLLLEITESAVMSDPAGALQVLNRLHDMGLKLSIDDFGTGYSSLAYLKQLPVSELKIDQSFVTHMTTDHGDEVICKSTIDLGHNLGLKVVAEGVEDQPTLEALRRLGCDLAQGYHLSRPLPPQALLDWMRNSRWPVVQSPGQSPGRES
ncbi:MAG TPA: EAL domain-containing protein [Geothrix sp.]|nr:EAL domain-containing protein [Geothrix sp.]